VPARGQALDWHLTAMVAESCSCAIACRCNFGGEPDGGKCEGNRIISIEQGHYNGVDLAGVQILVTFHMRTWSKIYISDTVSDAQMKAVDALMPLAFAGFQKGMLSFTRAPITMEVSDTRVRFSGPESTVDMEVMNGFNGQAVKILNLPAAVFQDYTQFRSVSHTHTSATHRWTHSGTNGFTSKWDVGSRR
jgi:hypothetical protein